MSCFVAVTSNCTRDDDGVMNEKQVVYLRGDYGVGFLGTWTLAFNGEVSTTLGSSPTASDVEYALMFVSTIGTVNIDVNMTQIGLRTSELWVTIEFTRSQGTNPQHYGSLPLVTVDTSGISSGLASSAVERVCGGEFFVDHTPRNIS